MSKAENTMRDVEAQNDETGDWEHARELERIRSAGVVTISPELFEKVGTHCGSPDAYSYTFSLKLQPLDIFVSDSRIQRLLGSWGNHSIEDLS